MNVNDIEVDYELVTHNNNDMSTIDLTQLSAEQRKELMDQLAKQEEAEKKKLEREQKKYEAEKYSYVKTMFAKAAEAHKVLFDLKEELTEGMDAHAVKLANYGKIRKNSKGGFQIESEDNTQRIKRIRDTEPTWDERATKAESLIKDFLMDTVKKRDKKTFEMLMIFLERNKNGDLELSRVMDLLQFEDNYDDVRWKEGLRLLKQSYRNVLKGFGYLFQQKGADGKWKSLVLNFSSI